MDGMIKVSYRVICQNDTNQEVSLSDVFANEKVQKAIKSEFAKGMRNIIISSNIEGNISLETQKEVFEVVVTKDDFADLLELAEEDAIKNKRVKKDCEGVELVDIVTIEN